MPALGFASLILISWLLRQGVPSIVLYMERARCWNFAGLLPLVDAVIACADAHQARGHRRDLALAELPKTLAVAQAAVKEAYGRRGIVPAFSPRRRQLKRHARQVVAVLKNTETRLDVDPNQALRDLAGLLLTIAERYAEGRVGALLDDEQIAGTEPVQEREALKMVLAALLMCATAAAALGAIDATGLPSVLEPVAIASSAMVALVLVYGRRASQRLEFLGLLGSGR